MCALFAGFQGRIHQGFFNFTMDVLPDVEDELSKHPSLKRLTIAGHSLGKKVSMALRPSRRTAD